MLRVLRAHRVWLAVRLAVVLPLILVTSGCAAANAAWRAGPMGMAAEWTIRDHLAYGRAEQAWAAMGDHHIAPRDALLRHMYRGVISLHAGQYEQGAKSIDRAWSIVDDRFTKRISRGAVSLVTSDASLPYYPLPTERLFIPYYGAMNWLAMGEMESASVEARRLAMMLQAEGEQKPTPELEGALRYITGVLFEAAGDRQDAQVAYRNAAVLLGTLPGDTLSAGADSGDVVVIVEDGFVARPQPQSLAVYTSDGEFSALRSGRDADRILVANRVRDRARDPHWRAPNVGWLTYEVNWATIGSGTPSNTAVEVTTNPRAFAALTAQVSPSVAQDFTALVPEKLARGIARAAVRHAALTAASHQMDGAIARNDDDDDDDDDGPTAGARVFRALFGLLLGGLAVSSTVIDQPDLRAWQVLPDRLTIARLRLPVGEHPIYVSQGTKPMRIGTATVRNGGVAVMHYRLWPGLGGRQLTATK